MQYKNGSADVTITPFDNEGLIALQGIIFSFLFKLNYFVF